LTAALFLALLSGASIGTALVQRILIVLHRHTLEHIEMNLRQLIDVQISRQIRLDLPLQNLKFTIVLVGTVVC
jgi:hypothetical protein